MCCTNTFSPFLPVGGGVLRQDAIKHTGEPTPVHLAFPELPVGISSYKLKRGATLLENRGKGVGQIRSVRIANDLLRHAGPRHPPV